MSKLDENMVRADVVAYSDLLLRWNKKINLVSDGAVQNFWTRHIEDCLQVFHVKQDWSRKTVDLGSGGGLPGILLAIQKKHANCDGALDLVESDSRKAAFLRTAVRQLDLPATVLVGRIEKLDPLGANTITARALASLTMLLEFTHRHLRHDGVAIFMKGAKWKEEIDDARKTWHFDVIAHPSVSDPHARLLEVRNISRVPNDQR